MVAAVAGSVGVIRWATAGPPADVGTLAVPSPVAARAAVTPIPTPRPAASPFHDLVGTSAARLSDLEVVDARRPVHLAQAAVGVDAPIVPTGVDPTDRTLDVPKNATTVVWWAAGARPGDPTGTSVLAAHVDYGGREGVFFRLDELPVGAIVTVATSGGGSYRYRVVTRRHVAKPALADENVFRADGPPRLALITCGGAFDPSTHSYRDNLIVLAVPA